MKDRIIIILIAVSIALALGWFRECNKEKTFEIIENKTTFSFVKDTTEVPPEEGLIKHSHFYTFMGTYVPVATLTVIIINEEIETLNVVGMPIHNCTTWIRGDD